MTANSMSMKSLMCARWWVTDRRVLLRAVGGGSANGV